MPPKERSGVRLRGEKALRSQSIPPMLLRVCNWEIGGVGVDMSEPPLLQMAEAQASGKQ